MAIAFAVLIDGGFLKHKLYKPKQQATADDIKTFTDKVLAHANLTGMRLHRVYYYDARPFGELVTKPLGGGPIDFNSTSTAIRNRKLQDALRTVPFFALRFGELVHHGWQLKQKVMKSPGPQVAIQ